MGFRFENRAAEYSPNRRPNSHSNLGGFLPINHNDAVPLRLEVAPLFHPKNFNSLTRFHIVFAFFALMLLRMVVGYHFFKEGATKLREGFDAQYFLAEASGPLAPAFHGLVRDLNGRERFGIVETDPDDGERRFEFDSRLTKLI